MEEGVNLIVKCWNLCVCLFALLFPQKGWLAFFPRSTMVKTYCL